MRNTKGMKRICVHNYFQDNLTHHTHRHHTWLTSFNSAELVLQPCLVSFQEHNFSLFCGAATHLHLQLPGHVTLVHVEDGEVVGLAGEHEEHGDEYPCTEPHENH